MKLSVGWSWIKSVVLLVSRWTPSKFVSEFSCWGIFFYDSQHDFVKNSMLHRVTGELESRIICFTAYLWKKECCKTYVILGVRFRRAESVCLADFHISIMINTHVLLWPAIIIPLPIRLSTLMYGIQIVRKCYSYCVYDHDFSSSVINRYLYAIAFTNPCTFLLNSVFPLLFGGVFIRLVLINYLP